MRSPWHGRGFSRRGRRGSDRPDATPNNSPYDFSSEPEEQTDPVDLLAIRADDELLDALAAGRPIGPRASSGLTDQLDSGYTDDQQVLALLQAWRADVESEPFPELLSVEEASRAIAAGQRASRPRRRLMPVATAAAVAVLALSGVAIGASNAQPGDPLWGVSTVLNGERARSVEAAYRVTAALSAVQQALAEGRTADARAGLAKVQADLNQVKDQQRRDELARKTANLAETVETSAEGERVETDESGARRDRDRDRSKDQRNEGGSSGTPSSESSDPTFDPRSARPSLPGLPGLPGTSPAPESEQPGSESPSPDPQDPRRGGAPESAKPTPEPSTPVPLPELPRPAPSQPRPAPESTKTVPETKPAPESKPADTTKPAPESKPATHSSKPESDKTKTKPSAQSGRSGGDKEDSKEKDRDRDEDSPRPRGAQDPNRGPHPVGVTPAVFFPSTPPGPMPQEPVS